MQKANKVISIILITAFFLIAAFAGFMEVRARGTKVIDGRSAFENEAVVFKNSVLYSVFGVSGNEQVIAGKDGWLFYAKTVDDYTGAGTLTDEEIEMIAAKLDKVRQYCAENGAEFCFVIVPNKNTVYPEYMPGYFRKTAEDTNYDKLLQKLSSIGADAPDLRQLFGNDADLYYKTDTHWNAKGASVLSDYLTEKYSPGNSFRYGMTEPECKEGLPGDLYKLLLPGTDHGSYVKYGFSDQVYSFAGASGFRYLEQPVSSMDMNIETENTEGKQGRLLVYRDSFGSELISLLSSQFGYVRYLRGNMPYDMNCVAADLPDAVVFVIAQRNIPTLLTGEFAGIGGK
ncbi:MAG: hypothetical protein J5950_10425 [Clostridia bacterium]|nr:hypothetical protein [Clostridia bacterium]